MRDDLQDLVDEISAVLGAPATLEDRDFTLLAFCAHDGTGPATPGATMDTVRARSILGRSSTPEVRARFESHGIATATSFSLLALRSGEIAQSLRTNARSRENAGVL